MKPFASRSAFTLIELLVVVAIIAILAGIALPVFGKVQERSRAISCASNLKQIGVGLQSYLNDHDDQYFPKEGKDDTSWPKQMNPRYVPDWKVFRSPFDKVTPDRPDVDKKDTPSPVSYGVNEFVLGTNAGKFVAPSQLMVMGPALEDADIVQFLGMSDNHPKLKKPEPDKGSGGGGKKRGTHFNRSQLNVLFADFHVSAIAYREFQESEKEEGLKRWYPEGEAPKEE